MLNVLVWECQGFFAAVQAVDDALQQQLVPTLLFMRIQWALDFAANVAKILWARPRYEEERIARARALRLRRHVGITKNRTLAEVLNNTLLRNALEHVDARLDSWGQTTMTFNLAMFNTGPKDMIVGLTDDERFMEYDPATHEIRMLRETLNLRTLSTNVRNVLQGAENAQHVLRAAIFVPGHAPPAFP